MLNLGFNGEHWQEAGYLAKLAGDWMPELAGVPHEVTVAEAWKNLQNLVIEMLQKGELGQEFQLP